MWLKSIPIRFASKLLSNHHGITKIGFLKFSRAWDQTRDRGFRMERLWTLGYWANVETTPGFFFFTKYFIFFSTKKFLQIFFRCDCDRIRFQRPWSVFFSLQLFIRLRRRWLQSFATDLKQNKLKFEIFLVGGKLIKNQEDRLVKKKSFLRPRVVI